MLSIIIPVYNEGKLVASALAPIFTLPIDKEIIIVNDGSTDDTAKALHDLSLKYDFRLITQVINQGKGAAVKRGLAEASGNYLIVCDADNEYDPQDIFLLLSEASKHQDSKTAVFGSRWLNKKNSGWHYQINHFLTALTNLLFGSRLTDMETCFKLIPSGALIDLRLSGRRFEIEPEMTAQLIKAGYQIKEVPISYRRRSYEEGKKIKPRDGLLAILTLLKEKFKV